MVKQMRMLPSVVAGLVLVAAAAACSDDSSKNGAASDPASPPAATGAVATASNAATTTAPLANAQRGGEMIVPELVKRVRPSVVRVSAIGTSGRLAQQSAGTGTGWFVDERGYVVTNNHVVTLGGGQPAGSFKIDLADGRTLDARLVGRDQATDLAVLKVEDSGFAALRFADPRTVEVGGDVVAVGFALDLGATPTVTRGVVSAKDRVIQETIDGTSQSVEISGAIQTDAAINPGNSGGPLLNLQGEVVGINTAGLSGGAGRPVQGISFAVSGQVAQPIVKSLIDTGQVRRGLLGIRVQTVDRDIAQLRRLAVNEGVLVAAVDSGSPADRGGLKTGDIITKVGDLDVKNTGDLTIALARYGPGTRVKVEYNRAGDARSAEVTPIERASDQ